LAEEEIAKLVVTIGADIKELKEKLSQMEQHTKKVRKATSVMGLQYRKVMLSMMNSSVVANSVMAQVNGMMGIMADTMLMSLMPAIQPILDLMWNLTESFSKLDENHKYVVSAIMAVVGVLYLLSAHPVVAVIAAVVLLLYLLENRFGVVSKAAEGAISVFSGLYDIFKKIYDVLFGHSLIPVLELMGNIIKTILMPQILIFTTALEGIKFLMKSLTDVAGVMVSGFSTAGSMITQSFTQVFNFLGSGIQDFQKKAEEGLSSVGSKLKSGLGF